MLIIVIFKMISSQIQRKKKDKNSYEYINVAVYCITNAFLMLSTNKLAIAYKYLVFQKNRKQTRIYIIIQGVGSIRIFYNVGELECTVSV